MMLNESRRSRAHFDFPLALLVFGLAGFGVLCVAVATFSTSSETEGTLLNYIVASYYGMRQAIFFLISPVVVGVITYFPYEFIRRRSTLFYYVACGLLLIALGGQAAGVKAWIDILWGYTIQPSEFVKLACIIVIAKYLETETDPMGNLRGAVKVIVLMGIPWALTLAQGEMGSVLVMIFLFGVMMFALILLLNIYICPYRVGVRGALWGSLLTLLLGGMASFGFSIYTKFSSMEKLYGAAVFLILFLLWLYVLMTCFIIGVVFNCFLFEQDGRRQPVHKKF